MRPAIYRRTRSGIGIAQLKSKIVQPDYRRDYAQPQPISGSLRDIAATEEAIEHCGPFILPDSGAGIDYVDLRPAGPMCKPRFDMPSFRGKFDCIVKQVDNSLE